MVRVLCTNSTAGTKEVCYRSQVYIHRNHMLASTTGVHVILIFSFAFWDKMLQDHRVHVGRFSQGPKDWLQVPDMIALYWAGAWMGCTVSRVLIVGKLGPAVSSPSSWRLGSSTSLVIEWEQIEPHRLLACSSLLPLSLPTQHDHFSSQEQSSIMNKDVQLDRKFLHTHLGHPASPRPPPLNRLFPS